MEESASVSQEDGQPPPSGIAGLGTAVSGATVSGAPVAMLKRALLSGSCLAVLAGILWLDYHWPHGFGLAGLGALMVAGGMWEYCRMARRLGIEVSRLLLVVAGVALFLGMWAGWAFGGEAECPPWLRDPGMTAAALIGITGLGVLAGRAAAGRIDGTIQAAGASALGLAYAALPLAFIMALREGGGLLGPMSVITTVAVCKATDTGGFFCGRLIGGPRLSPRVSPNKTVAGALGGMALATAVSVGLAAIGASGLSIASAVLYGLLMAPATILGDLAESALKRQAAVKDSGRLLSDQGGVLDTIDGLLLAAPLSYLFFSVMG